MNEKYKEILRKNRPFLVDEIDPENGLINYLESKSILIRRQAVTISRLHDPYKKNEAILDALHKRPDADFFKFCDALKESRQDHVVERFLMVDGPPSPSVELHENEALKVLERLGIDMREKTAATEIKEQIENQVPNSQENATRDGEHNFILPPSRSVAKAESSFTDFKAPQPIIISDIIVRRCEKEFYDSKKNDAYPMNRRWRGKCVIISIYYAKGQDPRQGSEVDENVLRKLFTELHFKVEIHRNLSAQEILKLMTSVTSDSHMVDDQCFVLFMMSHGAIRFHCGKESEVVFGSDGLPLATSQILEPLANCTALVGKPKLAFFQACRGDHYDQGYTQTDSIAESPFGDDTTTSDASPPDPISLKDFIVGFPTQSGFRSFRNTKNGSWYINAIVQVFKEEACKMDVSAMLRQVNGLVSQWLPKTTDPVMQQKGQIASISDNLAKPYLYLFPGIIEEYSN